TKSIYSRSILKAQRLWSFPPSIEACHAGAISGSCLSFIPLCCRNWGYRVKSSINKYWTTVIEASRSITLRKFIGARLISCRNLQRHSFPPSTARRDSLSGLMSYFWRQGFNPPGKKLVCSNLQNQSLGAGGLFHFGENSRPEKSD